MRTPNRSIRMVLALALASAALLCGTAFAKEVWKWVDKKGVTHYSDTPVQGAVRIDVNVQTYAAEEAAVEPTRSTTSTQRSAAEAANYDLIEVWRPENDTMITGAGGQVSVSIRVSPRVQTGHSVRLEMDGLRVSQPNSQETEIQLTDVPRGTHTLSASIVTSTGQTLIQSSPVTFHVQQPVVQPGSPPRPPRPTPR